MTREATINQILSAHSELQTNIIPKCKRAKLIVLTKTIVMSLTLIPLLLTLHVYMLHGFIPSPTISLSISLWPNHILSGYDTAKRYC